MIVSLFDWNSMLPLVSLLLLATQTANGKIEVAVGQSEYRTFCHTEAPHYDSASQSLFFVDTYVGKVCRHHLKWNATYCTCSLDHVLGSVVPVSNQPDWYIIGLGPYSAKMYWDGYIPHAEVHILGRHDEDAGAGTVFNDGKADCAQRLFMDTKGNASLFHYTKQSCNFEKDIDNEDGAIYNGIAWNSASDKLFLAETARAVIYSFDYNIEIGKISNRSVLFDFKANNVNGLPDGMAMDVDDNLWVAAIFGSYVYQISTRDGTLLRAVKMPARDVTSVIWGGPKLDTLFVTSSQHNLNDEEKRQQPRAGSVFAVRGLGTKGRRGNNAAICTAGCAEDGCTRSRCGQEVASPPASEFQVEGCLSSQGHSLSSDETHFYFGDFKRKAIQD
nr:PREDICTED: regucalcin-like [Bemisia tabaci]